MRFGFLDADASEDVHFKGSSSYFLTLVLVVGSYAFIGQLPLVYIVTLNETAAVQFNSGDLSELANLIGKNEILFLLLVPFLCALIALLFSIHYIHKWPIKIVFTAAHRFDWKRFFLSFFIWGLLLSIFLLLLYVVTGKVGWNYNAQTFFPLLLISLVLIPLQTTCEEVLFRGYLLKGFKKVFGKEFVAVIFSGLLFGLMHVSNPEIDTLGPVVLIYYILTGIFLGILVWKDNGLELSMGYHAMNNIFSALILTNDWQAFQTDALFKDFNAPSFGWDSLITLLFIQPILLLFFGRMYGWKWGSTSSKMH